jgi:hypothetical protein
MELHRMIKNLGRRAALAGAISAVGLLATTGAALASGIAATAEGTLINIWSEYCRRSEQWARRIRASTLSYAAAEGKWPVASKLIMWPTASGELRPRPSWVFQDDLRGLLDKHRDAPVGDRKVARLRKSITKLLQPKIDAARAYEQAKADFEREHGITATEAAADEACNHTYDIVHAILAAEPKTLLDVQVKLMAVALVSGVFGMSGEFDPAKLDQSQRAIYDLIVNLQKLTGRVLPNEHDISAPILAGSV